jgi:hypothetical protein
MSLKNGVLWCLLLALALGAVFACSGGGGGAGASDDDDDDDDAGDDDDDAGDDDSDNPYGYGTVNFRVGRI